MSYYRHGPFRPSGPVGLQVPGLTPYVKLLMIGCGVIWLLQIVLSAAWLGVDLARYLGIVPPLVARGFIWQPLTYIFLHSPNDVFHILFNMLMLWMFGGELERYWGSRSFLSYFLICGVGAGICVSLAGLATRGLLQGVPVGAMLQSGAFPPATIGASGALFGVFIAYGMVFARRTILFMFIFPMQARTMALIMVGISLFMLWSQQGGPVSHLAHLGGAATGYLYLKRAWRIGSFYRELRWKLKRRKFKMVRNDPDYRYLH